MVRVLWLFFQPFIQAQGTGGHRGGGRGSLHKIIWKNEWRYKAVWEQRGQEPRWRGSRWRDVLLSWHTYLWSPRDSSFKFSSNTVSMNLGVGLHVHIQNFSPCWRGGQVLGSAEGRQSSGWLTPREAMLRSRRQMKLGEQKVVQSQASPCRWLWLLATLSTSLSFRGQPPWLFHGCKGKNPSTPTHSRENPAQSLSTAR